MTDTAVAAEADVDSTEQAAADAAGPTRRLIRAESMGRGERARRVRVEIGDYEYTARCPKLIVWTNMAEIIADQSAASRGERRRKGDTERADAPRVTTSHIKLTSAVTLFLRGCLTAGDWEDLDGDLRDPDNVLDVPDLWVAGLRLIVEFHADMQAMSASIGMKIPGEVGALVDRIGPDGQLVEPEVPPQRAAPAGRKAPAKAGRKAR